MMSVAKFSLHMLNKEKGKSLFYIFSCTFSVMIMFLFINIIYNQNLQGVDSINISNYNSIFSIMLSFLVVTVIIGMSFYAYNFYLTSQTKEIGIYLLGGSKLSKIFFYLLVQNVVIFSFALVVGMGLGMGLVPLVNLFINAVVGVNYPIFVYNSWGFFGTIALTLMTLIYLAIVSTGFIYRHEIKDLLGMTREIAKKDDRVLVLPNTVYLVLMLAPFVMYVLYDEPTMNAAVAFVGVLGGFKGCCRYVAPPIIEKLQRKVLIDKKIGLISSAHVHHLIVQTCASLQFFLIIVIFMNTYAVSNVNNPLNLALVFISYVCLVLSVIMSFYYKILLEGGSHRQTFHHLFKMGYKKEEIAQMIKQEIFTIYFIAFLICFIHMGIFYIGCITKGLVEMKWAILNISIFVIAIVVIGVINYFTYKKDMLKEIR